MNNSEYVYLNFAQVHSIVVCFPPVVKVGEYFLLSVVDYKHDTHAASPSFQVNIGEEDIKLGVITTRESENKRSPMFTLIPSYYKDKEAYVVSVRVSDPEQTSFEFSLKVGDTECDSITIPVKEEYKLDKFKAHHWEGSSFKNFLVDQSGVKIVHARGKGYIFDESLRKFLIQQEDERRSKSTSAESSMDLSFDEAYQVATKLAAPSPKSKGNPQPKKKKTPSVPSKGTKKKTPPSSVSKKPLRSAPSLPPFHAPPPAKMPALHEFSPPLGMFQRPGASDFILTPDLIISSHYEKLTEYSAFVDKFLTEAQLLNGERDGSLAVITRVFPQGKFNFYISTRSRLPAGFLFYQN